MSRVAKKPISLPSGVEVAIKPEVVEIKGPKGKVALNLPKQVEVKQDGGVLRVEPRVEFDGADAQAGTTRALLNNFVKGVVEGFSRKLNLVGVGYRAQAQGKQLNLTLGFSHPVVYPIPEGITIKTPSQTEIVVEGVDRRLVGQVAADIRAYRSPEPYKGKGIRYDGEVIVMKEGKKK